MLVKRLHVGPVLRAIRHHRQESQQDVAERVGVNRAKVSEVESGANRLGSVRTRRWIAAGWRIPEPLVNDMADGLATVAGVSAAASVPESVLLDAIRSVPQAAAAPEAA
jgi:transcriptional regulator with XRE-family HTH domain